MLIEFLMETLSEETGKARSPLAESYGEPELPLFPDSIHVEGRNCCSFQYFPYRPEAMMRHVRSISVAAKSSGSQTLHRLRVPPPRKAVGVWPISTIPTATSIFEFCNQIRNGTLSADTVRQF